MTENKRFTLSQNSTFHSVYDNVENKPLGVFEFKDDEFPVYACFHNIIDLMNDLSDENEQLKKDFDSVSHNWALMYSEAKNKVEELSIENKKLKSINNQLEDRLEESGIGIALKMEHFND